MKNMIIELKKVECCYPSKMYFPIQYVCSFSVYVCTKQEILLEGTAQYG